jgi:hypothetical protein
MPCVVNGQADKPAQGVGIGFGPCVLSSCCMWERSSCAGDLAGSLKAAITNRQAAVSRHETHVATWGHALLVQCPGTLAAGSIYKHVRDCCCGFLFQRWQRSTCMGGGPLGSVPLSAVFCPSLPCTCDMLLGLAVLCCFVLCYCRCSSAYVWHGLYS